MHALRDKNILDFGCCFGDPIEYMYDVYLGQSQALPFIDYSFKVTGNQRRGRLRLTQYKSFKNMNL